MSSMTRTAASLIGIVAVFALVLYLSYGGSGDDSQGASPTPSEVVAGPPGSRTQVTAPPRSPAVSPTPPPAELTFVQGEPIDIPEDVALILGQACKDCEYGSYSSIYRAYRDDSGGVRIDRLFPPPDWGGLAIGSVAVGWPQNIIALAACPGAEPTGRVSICDSDQPLYKSNDGGVTWEDWGTIDSDAFVAMMRNPHGSRLGEHTEEAVIGHRPTASDPTHRFTVHPTGAIADLQPPGATFHGVVPGVGPVWGRILDGISPDYVLTDIYGNNLAKASGFGSANLLSAADFRGRLVRTIARSDEKLPWRDEYWVEIGISGAEPAIYSWPEPITVTGQVGHRMMVGNAQIDPLLADLPGEYSPYNVPVVIDDFRRTVHPISRPFLTPAFLQHRYDVLMVQEGPFARVSGAEDCLEVRVEPSPDAAVGDCVPEGVLLTRGSRAFDSYSETWLAVALPNGVSGYASTEYLEY